MAPAQALLYESLKEQLKEELKERLIRGDKSLLAGYLYALLFWPDSPRRAKVVSCPRTGNVVASTPALPDDFVGPKEEEIIELCLREKAQGRRVILFCRQTDTLDIQPEWKAKLEAVGLKAAILRAAPNKREAWVEKQVKAGVDVIITHPRKVETGIDLLDFPTIVWMAIDYDDGGLETIFPERLDGVERVAGAVNGNDDMFGDMQRPLPLLGHIAVTNGHTKNGRSVRQPSLFTNGQAKTNGKAAAGKHLNGQACVPEEHIEVDKAVAMNPHAPPPVPRPRLLIG